MHFYEWNIGDYAKKTQHLTNEEDLAYRRALDMYYDTEKPLDISNIPSLSRRLRVGIEALQNVIDEFFPGGENKHAEEKIAAYYAFIDRQKANGRLGGRPKKTQALPKPNPSQTQKNPVPSQPLPTNPLPTNQEESTRTPAPAPLDPSKPTPGEVCKALKSAGLANVNPGHAKLLMLLEAGATMEEFTGAAQDALAAGKPNFSYILGTVEGRRRDAMEASKQIATGAMQHGKPWYVTASGIEAKAKELKLEMGRDESFPDFKMRVYKSAGITQEVLRAAEKDFA